MKFFTVLALLVAACAAAPTDRDATITHQESDNIGVDGFKTSYQTSNGLSAQEEGQLVNAGLENEALVVRGQYSYTGPDGVVYTVSYTADENGYHPSGAHLPVAP